MRLGRPGRGPPDPPRRVYAGASVPAFAALVDREGPVACSDETEPPEPLSYAAMTPHYDSRTHAATLHDFASVRMLARLALLSFLTALPWARAAVAAEPAEPDTTYLGGEVPPAMVDLTLDQALKLGAENSPSGRSALAALRSAEGSRMNEAGTFDPVLFGSNWQHNVDTPVSSPFEASQLRTRYLTGGLSWLSPIGTGLT